MGFGVDCSVVDIAIEVPQPPNMANEDRGSKVWKAIDMGLNRVLAALRHISPTGFLFMSVQALAIQKRKMPIGPVCSSKTNY